MKIAWMAVEMIVVRMSDEAQKKSAGTHSYSYSEGEWSHWQLCWNAIKVQQDTGKLHGHMESKPRCLTMCLNDNIASLWRTYRKLGVFGATNRCSSSSGGSNGMQANNGLVSLQTIWFINSLWIQNIYFMQTASKWQQIQITWPTYCDPTILFVFY